MFQAKRRSFSASCASPLLSAPEHVEHPTLVPVSSHQRRRSIHWSNATEHFIQTIKQISYFQTICSNQTTHRIRECRFLRSDNGSVNRAATVDPAIDLGVASPLRVQHHVIRRQIIVKQFEPKFRLITGHTERNDSANPSMKHIARKAHQARLRFRIWLLRA